MAARRFLSNPNGALPLLLESFARVQRYVPQSAVALLTEEQLPMRLREPARAIGLRAAWRAWTEGERIWFLIGRLPDQKASTAPPAELELLFFSTNGEAVAAGAWHLTAEGHWVLNRILEPGDFLPRYHTRSKERRCDSPRHSSASVPICRARSNSRDRV